MAAKKMRPAAEIEDIVYQVLCWLKKWDLGDAELYTRASCFSFPSKSGGPGTRGWRDLEDVWVSPRGEAFDRDFAEKDGFDPLVLIICCDRLYGMCSGPCIADFDRLPGGAQDAVRRLFESRVSWYDIYLEKGQPFDDTEFDSYDAYWSLEEPNREDFKREVIAAALDGLLLNFWPWEKQLDQFRKAVKEHILEELRTIGDANGCYVEYADEMYSTTRMYAD